MDKDARRVKKFKIQNLQKVNGVAMKGIQP